MATICLLLACNKDVTPIPDTPKGNIFFFNGSFALTGEINMPKSQTNFILMDSQDSTYHYNFYFGASKYPYFDQGYLYTYPYLKGQWPTYWQIPAGNHTFRLVDSSSSILDNTVVDLDARKPMAVVYADSCGIFRSLVAADDYSPVNGKMGLRIINMSPVDGQIFLTVNNEIQQTLPASTHMGDHTGFIPMDVSRQDTLSVKAFSVSDSSTVLGRTLLMVLPGHAYTLLMTGYSDNRSSSYVDPRTGNTVSLQSNFAITPLSNF
ncbi:DUF4397 domain-containing protein [Chitinophaga niastensis]|nr:DUF4397 domain-containing protein [Chitinophaga niastensis]